MKDIDIDIPRCTATSRSGDRCKHRPIRGGTVCATHGGSAPHVRAKANERLLETKIRGELVSRGWEPVTDPLSAVQDLAGEKLAWLDICRDEIARLTQIDYQDQRGVQDVKPRIALYERAWSDAFQAVAAMVKLGIEARMVERQRSDAAWIWDFARRLIALARDHPDRSPDELVLLILRDGRA